MEKYLKNVDTRIYQIIKEENTRQEDHIELIASKKFVSKAVLEANGSILTNKYLSKRYYGGCEVVDKLYAVITLVSR